jgi:hypothetical protein
MLLFEFYQVGSDTGIRFLMLQIPTQNLLQSISNLHQMACRMSYFALSMHRVGICGLLIMTFGG